MIPFYILDLSKSNFDINKKVYEPHTQLVMDMNTRDNNKLAKTKGPENKIIRSDIQNIDEFIIYDVHIEKLIKEKIRTIFIDDFIDAYIQITKAKAYYSLNHKILIFCSNQKSFLTFKKNIKDYNLFYFDELCIDFDYIESQYQLVGINSAWFGQSTKEAQVTASSVHGNNIEISNQYKALKAANAEITNLSFSHQFNDEVYEVMVTKIGGIILQKKSEINLSLKLVEDIYTQIINK